MKKWGKENRMVGKRKGKKEKIRIKR